jgi:hypothetical protein
MRQSISRSVVLHRFDRRRMLLAYLAKAPRPLLAYRPIETPYKRLPGPRYKRKRQFNALLALGFKPMSGPQTVPNVVGSSQTSALLQLQGVGLVANFVFGSSSAYAAGIATVQSPPAGVQVALGTSILVGISTGPTGATIEGLEIYDLGDGGIQLAWQANASSASSFNVYVNDVLNQNVTSASAVVTGLQPAAYNSATGALTAAKTYNIRIVSVIAGVESGPALTAAVTVSPTSVQLTTSMKRLFPFPNTGLN